MENFLTRFEGVLYAYTGSGAEMQVTPNGKNVTRLSCAVGGGEGRAPKWVRLIFWEDEAVEAQKIFDKAGMAIVAKGFPDVSCWLGKDGKARCEQLLKVRKIGIMTNKGLREVELEGEAKESDGVDDSESSDDIPPDQKERMEKFLKENPVKKGSKSKGAVEAGEVIDSEDLPF